MKSTTTTNSMRTKRKIFALCGQLACLAPSHAATPLDLYKAKYEMPSGPLVRWQSDIDGDQKPEVFIQSKLEYYGIPGEGPEIRDDGVIDSDGSTGWVPYIAQPDGSYIESEGLEDTPGLVNPCMPFINNQWCFIGMIDEVGTRGVVTPQTSTQKYEPDSTIVLSAITVSGNHVKETELATYPHFMNDDHPKPLLHKYLDDDKFTPVRLVRVAWFAASEHVADTVADLRSKPGQAGAALKKWSADIDGDGKAEVFLARKDSHTSDIEKSQTPDWNVYLADSGANTYSGSTGIKLAGTAAVDPQVVPQIDPDRCFVGTVAQVNGRALVTRVREVRYEDPWNVIYAYTSQDGHLTETKLAEYKADTPNAVYDLYLADDKRTTITVEELAP